MPGDKLRAERGRGGQEGQAVTTVVLSLYSALQCEPNDIVLLWWRWQQQWWTTMSGVAGRAVGGGRWVARAQWRGTMDK